MLISRFAREIRRRWSSGLATRAWTRILTVGLDEESNRDAVSLASEHEAVFAAVGRHPNSATGWDEAARG